MTVLTPGSSWVDCVLCIAWHMGSHVRIAQSPWHGTGGQSGQLVSIGLDPSSQSGWKKALDRLCRLDGLDSGVQDGLLTRPNPATGKIASECILHYSGTQPAQTVWLVAPYTEHKYTQIPRHAVERVLTTPPTSTCTCTKWTVQYLGSRQLYYLGMVHMP